MNFPEHVQCQNCRHWHPTDWPHQDGDCALDKVLPLWGADWRVCAEHEAKEEPQ